MINRVVTGVINACKDLFTQIKFPRVNSLKFRLILSASLLSFLILPIIGLTLSNAFEQKLSRAIKNELSAYSYSILAVAEVENNTLLMPEQLAENQFNVIDSGLYASITSFARQKIESQQNTQLTTVKTTVSKDAISQGYSSRNNSIYLWQSYSLFSANPLVNLPQPSVGHSKFSKVLVDGKEHFSFSLSVSFSSGIHSLSSNEISTDNTTVMASEKEELVKPVYIEFPMTIHIIKDLHDFDEVVSQFQQQLWLWLSILLVLLFITQIIWLRWTLKPLHILQHELEQVEQGKRENLQRVYPEELLQVTSQLNLLLHTEQNQRQRYRNALSDLAHSLKTPLAVIHSQGDLNDASAQQLGVINRTIEHQLKRAQSAGESSWHLGANIPNVITKLTNSLQKIYRDKELVVTVKYHGIDYEKYTGNELTGTEIKKLDTLTFKGDEADLFEILGNLLDNACKAAQQHISIDITTSKIHISTNAATEAETKQSERLIIVISDDGSGIDALMKKSILQRGVRADTYQQGHGIGLAIVRDLVISYQGTLDINDSELLGGAEFILSFTN